MKKEVTREIKKISSDELKQKTQHLRNAGKAVLSSYSYKHILKRRKISNHLSKPQT